MTPISYLSLIFQFFAAFISFSTVMMALFAFIRFRNRFFLHAALFLSAFFVIALNTSLYHLFYVNKVTIQDSPAWSFVIGSSITVFFSTGLLPLTMDLLQVSQKSKLRLIPPGYAVLCLCLYILGEFIIPFGSINFVENILGIWLPSCVSIIMAVIFRKRYSSGIFKQEKKLIVILALVNLIFFILSFFFPVLSMIFPFIAIICFCLIALSVSFRHFFLTPHVKEGETLPQSFIESYSLTPRETQIICAILGGKTNKELSDMFFVSLKTIETHLGNIYRKTGVKNRLELFSLLRQ